MKKQKQKKLRLNTETLRALEDEETRPAAGGDTFYLTACGCGGDVDTTDC